MNIKTMKKTAVLKNISRTQNAGSMAQSGALLFRAQVVQAGGLDPLVQHGKIVLIMEAA